MNFLIDDYFYMEANQERTLLPLQFLWDPHHHVVVKLCVAVQYAHLLSVYQRKPLDPKHGLVSDHAAKLV